jgi:predicted nucleic acid-binding protein
MPQILENGDCVVPAHWHFEVANQLIVGTRRGRATSEEAASILEALTALPIEIDRISIQQSWTRTYGIAVKHKLTVYDAAYLELAARLSLPLLSFDKALIRAAQSDSVTVISG